MDLIERIPPQDIPTEESVLASCLLDRESLMVALEILKPEDFYRKAHENIFKTFQHLVRNKKPVDLSTVGSCLMEHKKLGDIGGAVFLSNLIDKCPLAVNIERYAEIVKTKSVLRELIIAQSKNIDSCYDATTESLTDLIDATQKSVMSINNGNNNNFITMADLTDQSYERYENLQAGKADKAIKTGFFTIDLLTGGFRGSKLIIIAARPRIGKTALMTTMTRNMVKKGYGVGIFEIEMEKEELDDRFMAAETGINSILLSTGKGLKAEDWVRINEAATIKSEWPTVVF